MIVYSYGGGKIIAGILNAIAMLCQPGGPIGSITFIAVCFGMIYAIMKAFYRGSIDDLLQKWFFPFLVGYSVLFIPKKTVTIHDIITQHRESVSNVPFGLAFCASLTSLIGYRLTEAFEWVLHRPDDVKYRKTGHIFGSDILMDLASYSITDADVAENMSKFVCNCIVYDLMLGRYSFQELKSSNDIWKLVRTRTAKNTRGIYFCEQEATGGRSCKYMSCYDVANTKLGPYIEAQSRRFARSEILSRLPFVYQALTGMSQSAQDLITQHIVMHSIVDGIERKTASLGLGHNYAVQKTYLQQRSSMEIAGGMVGNSIIALRGVLEAFVLILFLFAIPMLAFPMGIITFCRWGQMLIWINLWPPLYVMLNYVLEIIAQQKAAKIFEIKGVAGINMHTSIGLNNLYSDMYAFTGWASLFIPALAYGIMRGGFNALVSIATANQGGISSSASASAGEYLSGNYSYGNVNFDTMTSRNKMTMQWSTAARLSQGHMREDSGDAQMVYSDSGEAYINKANSTLPVQINTAQMLSTAYSKQALLPYGLMHGMKNRLNLLMHSL